MTIWSKCKGAQHFGVINAEPWRVVESQSILTSRNLVDTPEEYDILEALLELSKPSIDKNTDYLIFTPFHYPPLKYGSRFGGKFEPSLWYGSLDIETALSEVAYYRLLFLSHTEANLNYINIGLTAFQARVISDKGINLCAKPFKSYRYKISSRDNYTHSQQLGTEMRAAKTETFIYYSARSLKSGKNLTAFTAKVFRKKNSAYTFNFNAWQCIASKKTVDFMDQSLEKINFTIKDFSNDNGLNCNPEWV